ncbi:MAG: sigma-70 family RNA polymerase sigma factor [Verrucomicrobia bacterium]|nr:sigma-70 family RNA polymerase sigma factor [Verrucomicrobiota bacterium]
MSTDLILLRRYHEHADAFAFRELVQAHAGMVFATARRVTRDAALADDVAQETFLELARNAPVVRESVGAWLHRVARRRACNVVRAAGTRRRYEEEAVVVGTGPDRAEATWAEIEPLIDEALDELEETKRAALVEHFLEGRTQQEMAARLGVSQSTVSRTLEAGIAELRAQLRRKDVVAGLALGLLIAGHGNVAPPAALVASLGKIAVAGVGSGVTAKSALMASRWLAMWWRTVALVAVVSVVAAGTVFLWSSREGGAAVTPSGAAQGTAPRTPQVNPPPPSEPGVERDWVGRAFCPMCAMEHTAGRQPEHGIFVHAEQGQDVVYDLKMAQTVADFHVRYCVPSMQDRTAVHVRGVVERQGDRRVLALGTLERAAR